jgi:hypothetical protein
MDVLRNMEDTFNYTTFREELTARAKKFNKSQKSMLDLRLSLLDSCLDGGDRSNHAASFFRRGHLTIVEYVFLFSGCSSGGG